MKYMFASDIHGSAYYCKKMLEAYDKEKARCNQFKFIHYKVISFTTSPSKPRIENTPFSNTA